MPRKILRKERGVFEKEPGTGIWWIRYKIDGIERREKVGRRGDAIQLYQMRRADALRGLKLPANRRHPGVRFGVIGQQAIDWYIAHGRRDVKGFRIRMQIILRDFSARIAEEIKPSEIDSWLSAHPWSPATCNRYKNVFSKAFKLALADGQVTANPARMVEQRPEQNGRIRFLTEEEEVRLRAAIIRRCPMHLPELDLALYTGMRKGEQYSLEWSQVSLRRKRIRLEMTKNGSRREIPLNRTALQALETLGKSRPHDGRICHSKFGRDLNDSRKWFDLAVKEAEVANFRWHDLRHTFISRLVMKGVDLRTVQELAATRPSP